MKERRDAGCSLDSLMTSAVLDIVAEENAAFLALNIDGVELSQRVWRRVQRYASWEKHRPLRQKCLTAARRAAVILLAAGLLFTGVAMSFPTVRAAVWETLVSWYEDYIAVWFDDEEDTPDSIEEEILPTLPAGWKIEKVMSIQFANIYKIISTHGEKVEYHQMVKEYGEIWLDNEECSVEIILLNDQYNAYLCTYSDGSIQVAWGNHYGFLLRSDDVSVEVLIELAENINEKQKK